MIFLRFEGDLIAETWEVDPEQITRQLAGEADPGSARHRIVAT